MRFAPLFFILTSIALAQAVPGFSSQKAVTVPLALDHNRILVTAEIPAADGSTQRVRAWVDTGNPDLWMSRRVTSLLGLAVKCGDQECSAPAPSEIIIGGLKIPLTSVKEAKVPLAPVAAAAVLVNGMNADINLPSTILRAYDILIDFPGRQFTIGQPGHVAFHGTKSKISVDAENGLIDVPSQLAKKKFNLGLDLGLSISLLSDDLFDQLMAAHSDWPRMTGAIGPANMWGSDEEATSKVMRIDRVQYGPVFLTDVPVARLPPQFPQVFRSRGGAHNPGLLGAEALNNYRIGIDYAHAAVYFEIGRTFKFPDFDVVGLTLRPEADGRFIILAIADYNGQPSVSEVKAGDRLVAVDDIALQGSTLGQVWLMLGGEAGKQRRLTLERGAKQFTAVAEVRHFLGETEPTNLPQKKPQKP